MLEEARRSRRKKDKKPIIVKLLMCIVLIVLVSIVIAKPMLEKWLPSTEEKDLNEWFEVSGMSARIYLDNTFVSDYVAEVSDGEIYLPYDFVTAFLNSRFYYNDNEKLLSYTLSDRTDDYEMTDPVGAKGAEALKYLDGELYMALSLAAEYTDISYLAFTSDDTAAKRVFIYDGGTEYDTAVAGRTTAVRTSADKKAPILTRVAKGATVTVTDISGGYSRVATDDGIVGYADNDSLTASADKKIYEHGYIEPLIEHERMDGKVVLAWHTMYSSDANAKLADYYKASGDVLNVVSPQWLQISDADGSLMDLSSESYIAKAHELGLRVWVSVDNVNQPGGIEDFNSAEFFSDTVKRRDFIATLIDKALKYGYDGLNLDFESMPEAAGKHFTQFVRELAVECHRIGLTLSVDDPVPYGYNSYYDIREQAVFADYIIIMAYDEHYEGGEPGPVASLSYTEYAISASLEHGVPAESLVVGVPFYVRLWRVTDEGTSSETMGMAEAEQYVRKYGMALEFDDALGVNYGSRTQGAAEIMIWMEDDTSIALKADAIRAGGIAGIAAWRLGIESSDVWAAMDLNDGD